MADRTASDPFIRSEQQLKTVLVTGGTGFVGANLVRRLVSDGHSVWLLVRPGHQTWRIDDIQARVRVCEVDFSDANMVIEHVGRIRPDWIFHLAAYGAYPYQTDLNEMVRTNIQATVNLVRASLASGVEAFVNSGSSSEYGFKSSPPAEGTVLEPNSYYAVTKASATLFCQFTAVREGRWIPTLRLYSVFGPLEQPSRLMARVLTLGLSAGALPPLASPDTAHDFVYVDDVVEAYLRVATTPRPSDGFIYNVGTGHQTTLREVIRSSKRLLRQGARPHWGSLPDHSADTRAWVADSRLLRATFGWQPGYTVESGLEAFRDWLLAEPGRLAFYASRGG